MVIIDKNGEVAAGTSTNGATHKVYLLYTHNLLFIIICLFMRNLKKLKKIVVEIS